MSVQFGIWKFDGKPLDRDHLEKVKSVVTPYGPDHGGSYSKTNISILYRAFHTTNESRRETQPHVMESGAIITWDGRLDNRAEVIRQLRHVLPISSTDVSIAAAAYQEWGADCFAKLIGDWALSIWDPNTRSLTLVKDPIGTRHLYYSVDDNQVTWSSILDPLVLFAGRSFAMNEEYIAGWFSFFPAPHLTPYVGIHSVPPSSSVAIRPGMHTARKYWNFDPGKKLRYRSDAEYEEHFRVVFAEAVRRRLRSDSPILAELSGGMDSSSIVCMADTIIASGSAEAPRLDTVSYYDNSEPNWDECPYFNKVEEKRGRTGCHIDVGSLASFNIDVQKDYFAATPTSGGPRSEPARNFRALLTSQGNRVVLSGIGGDEITGAVPTPTTELADLLARARFKDLTRQLKNWALVKRQPLIHLLFEMIKVFLPLSIVRYQKHLRPVPWLRSGFARRHRNVLLGYRHRFALFGPPPSYQDCLNTLETLRRQIACTALTSEPVYERRYPFLDRHLMEFVFSIPQEQLLRPTQRRSLMRRALVGIVPDEILNRKRKAFVTRSPILAIRAQWPRLHTMTEHMLLAAVGIIDSTAFRTALQQARTGVDVSTVAAMRTVGIELWLENIAHWKILHLSRRETADMELPVLIKECSSSAR